MKKEKFSTETIKKAISAFNLSDARAAGYNLSAARAAGYSLSDAIAGYSLSVAIEAGYSLSAAIAAGYGLYGARAALDKIPMIDKPYTKLLEDINEKKRTFQQSTFGNIYDFDEKTNICRTPMCTAGHIINMAGKAGYKLLKALRINFVIAAQMIHEKWHPDFPLLNFSMIEQSIGLAYIETMAALEQGLITHQDIHDLMFPIL